MGEAKTAAIGMIPCEICNRRFQLARSVRIGVLQHSDLTGEIDLLSMSAEQYMEDRERTAYRRAFICEECYKNLDAGSSVPDHRPVQCELSGGTFYIRLSSESRRGRAAIYNAAKWKSYLTRAPRGRDASGQ